MKDTLSRSERPKLPRWPVTAGVGVVLGAVLGVVSMMGMSRESGEPALGRPELSARSTSRSIPTTSNPAPKTVVHAARKESTPSGAPESLRVIVRAPHGVRPPADLKFDSLFETTSHSYWLAHGLSVTAARTRLSETYAVFADSEGRLQAVQAVQPQRSIDPSVPLQWHNFGWPSLLVDRFPHTLDQNTVGLREKHGDEFVSWARGRAPRATHLADKIAPACPAHQPASLHVNRLWRTEGIEEALSGRVILHDGPIDSAHGDLQGAIVPLGGNGEPLPYSSASLLGPHATHLAGVMAARRNDSGVTGVAPALTVEAHTVTGQRSGFGVALSDVVQGIARIERRVKQLAAVSPAEREPAVVLLGYAFDEDVVHNTARGTPLRDALEILLSHDVVVVVPSGNAENETRNEPALPAVLAPFFEGTRGVLLPVSASSLCSERAWFSRRANLASGVEVFAPGERIFSTLPGSDYGTLSGTSQAAAQVAAVIAVGARLAPSLTARSLVASLLRTAQPLARVDALALMPDAWSFAQDVGEMQRKSMRNHLKAESGSQSKVR